MGTIVTPTPVPDNFEEVLCRFLKECTDDHDKDIPGGKPDKTWCRQPSGDPDCADKGAERGKKIGKCCEDKINHVKKRSKSDFAKTVKAEQWVRVPELGGSCKPDVIAGNPPNCAGVWDFKTSCPPLAADDPPPKWPKYGTGKYERPAAQKSWHGKTQADIYQKACGAEPVMIHENSEACS